MSHATGTQSRRTWKERALCLLLTAVMLFGLVPGLTLPASAHWADEYLDKLVDWGVMRPDQIGNPDSSITRADFMAIINRAYGYSEVGPTPFTDVSATDWFYDDVAIAYTAGYMQGTSRTTASPNTTLTREMAVCILGRNMMLKETPGESLAFSDSRDVSTWAAGLVKTAVDNYIVAGYPDNNFGPQDPLTKSQMAVLITQCVGTPLQEAGDYTLGGVFGNVTITSSDVTLRDTTISGDLYVSGGVGLGGVKLENVNVLGRVIVSGTGESEQGEASVVMRNVTANEMLVDNMRDRYVTVRAEGLTEIGQTQVRTNAYLEDNTPAENGLRAITLEGDPGTRLDLAGRIKEVVNRTPNSIVEMAKGSLQKLTVDEAATTSTVQIDRNTDIKELNLDVAATVNGQGDIDKLNVNAAGSTVTMLPDDIYVRPGLNASIAGEVMDSAAAEESSLDPRILSGYPAANDVASTSLRADFAGNKRGTIYWAVSNITDGSVSADDLISPPTYGSLAVKNGSVATPSAGTVVPVAITGLTNAGSYYLSAVLVDSRGERSPVKVISFTTPDNSKPAFATGYPYMSLITDTMAQTTVMATKSCKLYYAVLPQGATAPTTDELRSASVTGNLGYGVVDVVKNTEHTFTVSRQLEEKKSYVLYLWLCDADGANSSAVQRLQFTTVDKTPPLFDPDPDFNAATITETSVSLTAGLNEAGTIYWVAVPEGTPYPLPNNQNKDDNITDENGNSISARLDSEYAKLQVANGRNATKRGTVAVRNADTDVTINITGLTKETSYDLYYVAMDTAGNYSESVKKITIHTLDTNGPIVRQYFSDFQGEDETKNPMANSDLILRFNENVLVGNNRDLLTLYEVANGLQVDKDGLSKEQAADDLYTALSNNFVLYQVNTATNVSTRVPLWDSGLSSNVWVNYRNVVIRSVEEGGIEVVFPGSGDVPAVSLSSGSRYNFELTNITDASSNRTSPTTLNPRNCVGTQHVLDYFDTVFALVDLAPGDGVSVAPVWKGTAESGKGDQISGDKYYARVDTTFMVSPRSTQNADPDIRYELIILTDSSIDYDLYYRIIDTENNGRVPVTAGGGNDYRLPESKDVDDNGWVYLGNKKSTLSEGLGWDSGTVIHDFIGITTAGSFPYLQTLSEDYTYEFAISVTGKDASAEYEEWSGQVNFRAYVIASNGNAVRNFVHAGNITPELIADWDVGVTSETGRSIGNYGTSDYVGVRATFVDTMVPTFTSGPSFTPGDTFVDVQIALTRPATIYYVIAPKSRVLETRIDDIDGSGNIKPGTSINSLNDPENFWTRIEDQTKSDTPGTLTYKVQDNYPPAQNLSNPSRYYRTYNYGTFTYESGGVQDVINVGPQADGNTLEPETDYYIYMVVKGTSAQLSEVYVYNFTTSETARPKIDLQDAGSGTVRVSTTNDPAISANIDYAFFTTSDLRSNPIFTQPLSGNNLATPVPEGAQEYTAYIDKFNNKNAYTILDALMTTYAGDGVYNGYSVFDVYANTNVKNQVADIIRRTSAGSPIRSSVITQAGGYEILDHTKDMNVGEYYYVLAVGHHTSGTTDGFKAVYNIVVPDTEPPRIDSINTSMELVTGTNNKYSGSVTLTFTKPVYWIEANSPDNTCIPVIASSNNVTDTSNKVTSYGITKVLGGSLSPTVKTNQTAPSQTFTLWFEGANAANLYGTLVMFDGNGRIANASGRSDGEILTFVLMEGPVQTGNLTVTKPYFTTTYTDSSGRSVTVSG